MTRLILNLEKCRDIHGGVSCPYSGSDRTIGSGYAEDYFCKLVPDPEADYGFKETSGYVEWPSDVRPIPEWCPIRDKENV